MYYSWWQRGNCLGWSKYREDGLPLEVHAIAILDPNNAAIPKELLEAQS